MITQTFEQIVSDTYANNEFSLPEIETLWPVDTGEISDAPYYFIRRKLGAAAVTEQYLPGQITITQLEQQDGSQIIHTEQADGRGFVTDSETPHFIGHFDKSGSIVDEIIDNTPRPLRLDTNHTDDEKNQE